MKATIFSLIQQHGNIGLTIALFLEFIGFPVPGEPLMAFWGYMTWSRGNSAVIAILFSVAGTFAGSLLAYGLGARYGNDLLLKYGKYIFLTTDKLDRAEKVFRRHRVFALLFGRYVAGIRHVVPYICGISRIDLRDFLFYNLAGSLIWCLTFIYLGIFLGEDWALLEHWLGKFSIALAGAVILTVIVLTMMTIIRKQRRG